jgi:hypothetical protein
MIRPGAWLRPGADEPEKGGDTALSPFSGRPTTALLMLLQRDSNSDLIQRR